MASVFEILGDAPAGGTPTFEDPAFVKGLRSGFTGAQSQLHALAGTGAEALGFSDFAADRYARSRELQSQAASEAPPVRSYKDVNDLSTGFDYVTGLIGQSIPVTAAALAGGGAGLAAKGGAAILRAGLGSTAALTPFEAGDIVQRQQDDPVSLRTGPGERLATALGGGAASAAAQSIVPGTVAAQIAGKTARAGLTAGQSATRGTLLAGTEGAAEATGEAIKQGVNILTNQDLTLDSEALKEAAVGGVVAGGVMAAPGTLSEMAHSRAQEAGKTLSGAVGDALAKTRDGALEAGKKVSAGVQGLFPRRDDATARSVAGDALIDEMPEGADPASFVAENDAKATEWATAKATEMLADSNLSPDMKANLGDLLARVSEPAARVEIASMALARRASQKATDFYDHMTGEGGAEMRAKVSGALDAVRQHVESFTSKPLMQRVKETREAAQALMKDKDLRDDVRARLREAAENAGNEAHQVWVASVQKANEMKEAIKAGAEQANADAKAMADAFWKPFKKSEDFSGARAVIAREIEPILKSLQPEVLESPEAMDKIANGIRHWINQAREGQRPENNPEKVRLLRELLGTDVAPTLARIYYTLHGDGDAKATRNVSNSVLALTDANTRHTRLANVVKQNLKDRSVSVDDAVEALTRYTRGEHIPSNASESDRALREFMAKDEITKVFGEDATKVLDAFQKDREDHDTELRLDSKPATQGEDGDLESARDDAAQSGVVERQLEETEPEFETPRVYRGKDGAAILSLTAHRRKFGKDSQSQFERLLARAEKDNPDRDVSFMSVSDFEDRFGERPSVPEGADENDYGVIVAQSLREKQEGTIDLDNVKLDTTMHSRSSARIDTNAGAVDAVKITREALKRLPYINGESNTRRIGRAFFEGLGSVLIQTNTNMPVLKDSTFIGTYNGVKMTYGDIKHYRGPGEVSTTAKLDPESELTDLKRLLPKTENEKKREFLKEEIENLERRIAARDRDKKVETPLEAAQQRLGVFEIDPEGNIHEAAIQHDRDGGMERNPLRSKGAARAVEAGGTLDASSSGVRRGDAPAKPAQPAEHVPAPERSVKEDAKDLVAGGSASEAILARYTGVPETRGGQVILPDGSTREANVGTSYKSNVVPAVPASPVRIQSLIEAINDVKVKNRRELMNANLAIERLNDALGEALKKSPEIRYALLLKRDLTEADEGHIPSNKARSEAEKYLKSVLPFVRTRWEKMAHAGQFEPGEGPDAISTIRLSVHALDPIGTAYHESLHAFFKSLRDRGNHEVMRVLHRAADSAPVMNQLRRLLANEPAALQQIEKDREERVAYMYQFFTKKMLTLGPETKNVFERIKNFILDILGIWSNDRRAEHIMEWFASGEFKTNPDRNAIAHALMAPGTNRTVEMAKRLIEPITNMGNAIFATGAARMRDTDIPSFRKIVDLIQPDVGSAEKDVGFIQAHKSEHIARMNRIAKKLKPFSEETLEAAHIALKEGVKRGLPADVQAARDAVREYLDEMFDYMTEAGIKVRDLGYKDDYFPRVYDQSYISRHSDEFIAMLEKNGVRNPNQVLANIMTTEGAADMEMPGMQHLKERKLENVDPKFLEKNLFRVLNAYTMQAARRAEWARRFGADNNGMKQLLKDAREKDGATQEEIDMAQDFIRGIDGTLGDDINPTARRLFGNIIVYQNIRLLPLALFSQVVDPMGIMVRGGTAGDAWKAFTRGIREIPRGFRKNKAKDEWYELAEDLGSIDDTTLLHTVGASYTQGMVSDNARKINDTLFKFNMVEQFTTSMRVAATEAAVRFFMRHADGKHSPHSARWLAELGFEPGEIIVKDGRPLIAAKEFEAHGMSAEAAAAASNKMRGAINRWVDGAILRPNSADKPIWFNDPRWALVAHLKQFTYAFHNTILKRAWHEMDQGNYGPVLALSSYVPIMLASDFIKGFIQGGGEQPHWKKGWDLGDYTATAIERAGLYGVYQIGVDFLQGVQRGGSNVFGVLGPTVEQLAEALYVVGGKGQYEPFVMRSMPANALYAHVFRDAPTEPDQVL